MRLCWIKPRQVQHQRGSNLSCALASRAHLRIVAAVAGAATFGLRIPQPSDLLQLRLPVVFLAPGGEIPSLS
jgi:hypothetical protein